MKRNVIPQMRFIWNRKKNVSKNGLANVTCEVLYRRERKWIVTGVKVAQEEWSESKQRVIKRSDMLHLNAILDNIQNKLNKLFLMLIDKNLDFSFDYVEAVVKGEDPEYIFDKQAKYSNDSFIEWCEDQIYRRSDISDNTRKTHITVLNKVRQYNESVLRNEQLLLFKDITDDVAVSFINYLTDNSKSLMSVRNYINILHLYCKIALELHLIDYNPFSSKRPKVKRTYQIKYILNEDLEKIKQLSYNDNVDMVRDCFLFQCMTGMAYSDAKLFDLSKCKNVRGKLLYQAKRVKTGEVFQVVIIDKVLEILKRHEGKLTWYSIPQYNVYLKFIQSLADIKVSLSSHVARHSFAMICLNNNTRIEVLAKMLGHANIKTTQIYAQVLTSTVVDAFEDLGDVF